MCTCLPLEPLAFQNVTVIRAHCAGVTVNLNTAGGCGQGRRYDDKQCDHACICKMKCPSPQTATILQGEGGWGQLPQKKTRYFKFKLINLVYFLHRT